MKIQLANLPIPKSLAVASLGAYLGALSFGYTIAYSSPALPDMKRAGVTPDSQAESWFGSLVTIGAIFGGPVGGWLLENVGRRKTMLFSTIPFFIGWSLIFLGEKSLSALLFGRTLTGLGCAIVMVSAPVYISEIATTEMRGMLGSGVQLFITIGIFFAYAFGLHCGWKTMALIGVIFPVANFLIVLRIPESPRFCMLSNSKQAALQALSWLRGPHANVEDECDEIAESLPSMDDKISWGEFLKPQLLQPLRVSVGLMVLQQLSGINAVMFYTVSIFEGAGMKENSAFATAVVGAVQVVATIVSCVLMDKAGRRVLLVLSGTGMALTCFTFGYYYYMTTGDASNDKLTWLPLTSLVVYIISFSIGWGPIPMLITSEIFPVRARGVAGAITAISNWLFAFIITKEFVSLQAGLGQHGVFWLFGLVCVIGLGFVFKFVPETKGKSLEDIELYFLGRAIRGI